MVKMAMDRDTTLVAMDLVMARTAMDQDTERTAMDPATATNCMEMDIATKCTEMDMATCTEQAMARFMEPRDLMEVILRVQSFREIGILASGLRV